MNPLYPYVPTSSHTDSFFSSSNLTSPIITLVVGPEARLFACHESVLQASPFFAGLARNQFFDAAAAKRIDLPDELPEVFSSVLEFLYKGDYYPRLLHNKRRNAWELEDLDATTSPGGTSSSGGKSGGGVESTIYHPGLGGQLLKDTLLYCAAERYGLEELKRVSLRKQGLRSGVQCATILASARYAYDHTPESDSKLRAHYLALIIRSRHTFKRSGTMQMEMEAGGRLFFDLFVAMSNHVVSEFVTRLPARSRSDDALTGRHIVDGQEPRQVAALSPTHAGLSTLECQTTPLIYAGRTIISLLRLSSTVICFLYIY